MNLSSPRDPRETVMTFYQALADGQSPERVAELFSETAEWEIWGDRDRVPWVGSRTGRAEVADFFAQLRELTEPVAFDVHRLVVEGDTVVALGQLATRVNATGRVIESAFAAHIVVSHGLIETYRFFEDTWAVSQAMRRV
jgi:ketosteroid isomerase-like protein